MYPTDIKRAFCWLVDGPQDIQKTIENGFNVFFQGGKKREKIERTNRSERKEIEICYLVFPPPDVPKMHTNSPRFKLKDTPLRAAIPSIPNKYVL